MEGTMVVVVVMVPHREATVAAGSVVTARPRVTPHQPTALKEGVAMAAHLPTTCTRGVHQDLKGVTEGPHPREDTRGDTGVHPKAGMLHHHSKAEGATVPDNGTNAVNCASTTKRHRRIST